MLRLARSMFFASAIIVATVVVTGQQPSPAGKMPVTVLTGCLRSSGADTAIAGPSGRLYTLEVIDAPSPAATATTRASATSPAPSKTTYSLSAVEAIGLAKHVDHQVQLTGQLQMPSTAVKETPGVAATPDRKPAPGGGHRTFEVTALKMIAPKCGS